MTGKVLLAQILLPTIGIGGSVSITNTLSTDTENRMDPNIQPTIVHLKQATELGHIGQNHLPIRSLNIGIDVPRCRRNIDIRTGINPQGSIVTIIP